MKSDVIFGLEHAGWPVLVVDAMGTVCQMNKMAEGLFRSSLEPRSNQLSAIWSDENASPPAKFFTQWELAPAPGLSLKLVPANGGVVSGLVSLAAFHSDGQKYFVLQLLPDPEAGESKAAQGETTLIHKQKLDCALRLARTVSLDFNNALTGILGHTSLLLSKAEPAHPWRASLLEVEKAAGRAAEIANDLGTFSRQEKESRTQTTGNLNPLMQRCVEFFRQNGTGEPIAWAFQLERNLYGAKFDELKMQQVILRILENSIQALNGNGRIAIQTRNVELSEATQDRNVRLAPGAYVCTEISDNGTGIPADVLPRIFEPFFTTKKDKKHRGLGLAWVYGIVTNHGGGVAVSSQPTMGTSVRVYLPAEKKIVADNGILNGDLTGTQTVLMVDDEDLILTMGQTILSSYGYKVLTANGGKKALELLAKPENSIDLVVTDLVMPAMSGRELIEEIQRISPGMRIIRTSGYAWPGNQSQAPGYLAKPFTSQQLLTKVKHALADD